MYVNFGKNDRISHITTFSRQQQITQTMSWWGSSKKTESTATATDSSLNQPETISGSDNFADNQISTRYGETTSQGHTKFEEKVLAEQQNAMVQAILLRLTEVSFEKCVAKPTSSLTAVETECIRSVAKKYLETSQFVDSGLSQLQRQQGR